MFGEDQDCSEPWAGWVPMSLPEECWLSGAEEAKA